MSAELLRAIEQAAVRGWPTPEAVEVHGWLWRYASGGSIRGNSVATLAFEDADLTVAIERCEQLYAAKSAPVTFTISDVSVPSGLDAILAERGYLRGDDHVTMSKAVALNVAVPDGVTLAVKASTGWMEAYLSGLSVDRQEAAPRLIAGLPASAVFVADAVAGRVTTCGLTVIDGDVASIQCMATLPDARRLGGAQRVLAAIEAVAAQQGSRQLYLQTGGDNVAAQRLYARCGFAVLGRYHTRTRV